MYEEDSDGQKINKVPAVEELLASYPLPLNHVRVRFVLYVKMAKSSLRLDSLESSDFIYFHPCFAKDYLILSAHL